MTPQIFTVKHWSAWKNDEGVVRDNHGNYKGSVVFEEEPGEPVDATFKTEPQPGDKKYGVIEDYKTSKGATRQRFARREKPQENAGGYSHGSTAGNTPKKEWTPRDDSHIRAQWAIGQAVTMHADNKEVTGAAFIAGGEKNLLAIEATAKELYAMVDRVKDSGTVNVDNIPATPKTATMSEAELASLAESKMDEPIDLSSIPF